MHKSGSCIGRAPSQRMARPAATQGPRQIRLSQVSPQAAPFTGTVRSRQMLSTQQQRHVVAQGLFGLGVPELVVIAGVAALIFGPSKLPELGKGLGKTVKSFQTAAKEFETELKAATADDDKDKPADKKQE
jgi:sec-independent protein translocase protein TatA